MNALMPWPEEQPSLHRVEDLFEATIRQAACAGLQGVSATSSRSTSSASSIWPAAPPSWPIRSRGSAFATGLYRTDWDVYAKPPFGGVEHVFRFFDPWIWGKCCP
ncbi:MAG: hypothetical protein J7M25_08700 [Deltaproteobacteria bacterium]|nr:hypothetical protein [Deltaproteobacteria bacterium]